MPLKRHYAKHCVFLLYRNWSAYRRCLALTLVILAATVTIYKLRSKGIPVYIVEEHHEALVYWFEAATDKGLIPGHGNTLVHIDAHSDDSTPEYIPNMPRFQPPRNEEELSFFLQRNDVFIQGAVMTGLVSRVVWIWPSWDIDQMNRRGSYESSNIQLGWYIEDKGVEPQTFCQCIVPVIEMTGEIPPVRCTYVNENETDSEKRDVAIDRDQCKIMTSYFFETVNEVEVLDRLNESPAWLKDVAVLDIDEDFFGCENPAKSLVGDDIAWTVIESVDHELRSFLCPKHIEHELASNLLMKDLLRQLHHACQYDNAQSRCQTLFTEALDETFGLLLQEFIRKPSMFCGGNDFKVRTAWKTVAEVLYKLSPNHIERILQVGFCLSRAPKSLFFFNDVDPTSVIICHGLNEPDSDIVFLHTAPAPDVMQHMELFQSIVRQMPEPKLVTLCRSVRDGFTPRNLSQFIETSILTAFDAELSRGIRTYYDDDLLGGQLGWTSWVSSR